MNKDAIIDDLKRKIAAIERERDMYEWNYRSLAKEVNENEVSKNK